ncbi:MAG: DEAD/DEAH box helicase, partial [Rubrobacteraceae bacterium]|nr:DEAD/DEAH box helicase [Rubrobacteraceae bacterium]
MTETRVQSSLSTMSRQAVESLGDTVASLPPREATLVKMPDLEPELSEALRKMGASRLYSHQLEAYERVRAGENVVVATATASGKSLCYKIPAFQNALGRASRRAVFLYPTKALAQDQLGKIKAFGLRGVHPATYDGDTPRALRADIRRKANVLLTNPDMLNIGILPNHEAWADFLRNLEIVAVDEAHVLRGVFGSHVAAVLRRLRRVAKLHGGDPRFVLTSATIANPQELAESLTGLPFALVDNDGASTGERRVVFRNPPLLDKEKGERRSLLTEGALVFANLVSQGVRTIAFARTRKAAELIYRYAANRLGVEGARRISPYRAGYTPRERREIEGRLFRGDLLGVVSTNALELGVDVGALDAVVCCGYPGSVASVWQQWGRAGRGKDPALAVYIPGRDSLDQFLFENPPRVLGRRVEAARVTMENPYILGPHLLAAAHEAPLDADDEEYFGPAYRSVAKAMMEARALASSGGRLVYVGGDNPARNISLRSASSETVLIADGEGELIGTAEATRAPSELHPGATYLHRGTAYEVESLDLQLHRAVARRVPNRYYTRPRVETDVEILEEVEARDLANGAMLHW